MLELPSTGWLRRYRVRAHGEIAQAQLDALREGVTIDGVDYAGIEARLEREQGSNVWITMGLREGKNREIKRVLEHLGLSVNRLIRVSFGPFELGDLAEGAVAEVHTRVLRDQLGLKLAKQAGANFDAPIESHVPPSRRRLARGGGPAAAVAANARDPGPRPRGPRRNRARTRHARPAARDRRASQAQARIGVARRSARGRRGPAQAHRARRHQRPQGPRDQGRADRDRAPAGSGAPARPETAKRRRQARGGRRGQERQFSFRAIRASTRIGEARTGRRPRRGSPS